MGGAGFLDASVRPNGATHITSGRGNSADRRFWRIWYFCADSTITAYMRAGGESGAGRRRRSSSWPRVPGHREWWGARLGDVSALHGDRIRNRWVDEVTRVAVDMYYI